MSVRVLVIGGGQFGAALARNLAKHDADVVVVDSNEDRINDISSVVNRAMIGDATDARVIESLDPMSFDVVVNAIGEESLEASILCAALLGQVGARRVVARVTSDLHARILSKLGVDETVHPESYVAESLARRISAPGVVAQLELGEGAQLLEFEVPEAWIGQNLAQLNLRARHQVTVIAIRKATSTNRDVLTPSPSPETPLTRGEKVLILGTKDNVARFTSEIS